MHGQASVARFVAVAVVGVLGLMLAASCGGGSSNNTATPTASGGNVQTGATTIHVTLQSFKITMDKSAIPAGKVHFVIDNKADIQHEFVVFKTSLAEDQLPLQGNQVKEDAAQLTKVDEHEAFDPGTATLDVTLQPGHYVVICNLPNHYKNGMHASLTVNAHT